MTKIGETPLGVGLTAEPFQQLPVIREIEQRGHDAAAAPELMQRHEGIEHLGAQCLRLVELMDLIGAEAQQAAGQCRANRPFIPGAGECLEDKGDFPRFLSAHYRVAAEEHGADLAVIERLLHDGGFISVAHQNGDIPGAQRLLTAGEAALTTVGGIEQTHDFGSSIFGQQFTGLGLVEALVRIFLEQPELQRRRVCAGREQLFAASVIGLDRLERDASLIKGSLRPANRRLTAAIMLLAER